MALDTHVVTLAALRFVGGVASAFVIVIASTLVLERLSVPHRGHLSAVHFAGVGAGIIVSAAGVSAMVSVGAGWRTLWIGSGAIALVATSLVALLIGGKTETTRAAATSGRAQPLTGLPFLVVAYGLFGFGYVITATFLVALVRMTPEVRSLETWIWVLFGFSALPSVALWSWVGSRIGLLLTFNLACLAEAIGVAASVEWVTMFGIFISAVLLGGTFMGITAIGLMAARQLSGAHSQRAIGLMTARFAVGQMIGPTVAGVLFDRLGSFRAPSLVAAVALVIAAALALVTSKAAAQQKLIQ
jgi:predicted MFS family arabinose efflux permease